MEKTITNSNILNFPLKKGQNVAKFSQTKNTLPGIESKSSNLGAYVENFSPFNPTSK